MKIMKITKLSPVTGKANIMDLPITYGQFLDWQEGALIQHVMPDLSLDEREFLITGMTPEDWNSLFPLYEEA